MTVVLRPKKHLLTPKNHENINGHIPFLRSLVKSGLTLLGYEKMISLKKGNITSNSSEPVEFIHKIYSQTLRLSEIKRNI